MKAKRAFHKNNIESYHRKIEEREEKKITAENGDLYLLNFSFSYFYISLVMTYFSFFFFFSSELTELSKNSNLVASSADEISATFSSVIAPKKRKIDDLYKEKKNKKQRVVKRDEEFYIPYAAPDKHTEEG